MNTLSVEEIEKNPVLMKPKEYYTFWRRSDLEKDADLSEFSTVVVNLLFSDEPWSLGKYSCKSLLRVLEEKGIAKPFMVAKDLSDTLKEISEIIQRRNQLLNLEYEKEVEFAAGPPDEYFVEGIHIDWRSAFKYHEKLNKLRKKHGIRQI